MKPYYEHAGITLYHGDCREVLPMIVQPNIVIVDPVWPNSVFPDIVDPAGLFAEATALLTCERMVVHLGCDSDPRFLLSVPVRLPFFRVCWLEYARPSYKGRVLYTGDVAYAFGSAPSPGPGRMVIPGKYTSTRTDKLFQRTDKTRGHKHYTRKNQDEMAHPSPRRLQHVRWLVKWFGDGPILDPFSGTGTTLVAAKDSGLAAVGIEREERYCELTVNRLRQEVLL